MSTFTSGQTLPVPNIVNRNAAGEREDLLGTPSVSRVYKNGVLQVGESATVTQVIGETGEYAVSYTPTGTAPGDDWYVAVDITRADSSTDTVSSPVCRVASPVDLSGTGTAAVASAVHADLLATPVPAASLVTTDTVAIATDVRNILEAAPVAAASVDSPVVTDTASREASKADSALVATAVAGALAASFAAIPTTAEIEAALLNEGDGQALLDAIKAKIAEIDLSGTDIAAVASAVHAALLATPVPAAGLLVTDTAGIAADVRAILAASPVAAASVDAPVATDTASREASKADVSVVPAAVASALAASFAAIPTTTDIEASLLDEGDGQALLDAIKAKIAELDLSGTDIAAIAAAVRTELATEMSRIDTPISACGTSDLTPQDVTNALDNSQTSGDITTLAGVLGTPAGANLSADISAVLAQAAAAVDLDPGSVTAIRDALLNQVLAGHYEVPGSVGAAIARTSDVTIRQSNTSLG